MYSETNQTTPRPNIIPKYGGKWVKVLKTGTKTIIPKFNFTPKFNHVLQGLSTIESLFDEHPAKFYLRKRKIPEKYFSKLYFCTKFKEWTNKVIPNKFRSLKKDTPRLVIPFFDKKNNIIGYQGRSFDPKDQCKYITIKLEGVENLIFGQERLDINKKQYCVEGPLDSLFLPNCLAIAVGRTPKPTDIPVGEFDCSLVAVPAYSCV